MARFKIVVTAKKRFLNSDLYMLANRIGANRCIGVRPNGGDTSTEKRTVYFLTAPEKYRQVVEDIAEDIRKTLHFKVEVSDA